MNVWPAVDLLDGRCVRLYKGRFEEVTEFSREPVEVAETFVAQGARHLHVVDLDGARDGRPAHAELILEIRRRVDARLQVGGGIREDDDVRRYLEAGVDRVIVGTAAVRRPGWLARLVERHGPEGVAAGVDVRDGEVVVEGWREDAGLARDEALDALADAGVQTVVYTDTVRDGTLTRPDVDGARRVADRGFRTLVAGGVARVEDVVALREAGVDGVVVGSALYRGTLGLQEAMEAARGGGDRPATTSHDGGRPPGEGDGERRTADASEARAEAEDDGPTAGPDGGAGGGAR